MVLRYIAITVRQTGSLVQFISGIGNGRVLLVGVILEHRSSEFLYAVGIAMDEGFLGCDGIRSDAVSSLGEGEITVEGIEGEGLVVVSHLNKGSAVVA